MIFLSLMVKQTASLTVSEELLISNITNAIKAYEQSASKQGIIVYGKCEAQTSDSPVIQTIAWQCETVEREKKASCTD